MNVAFSVIVILYFFNTYTTRLRKWLPKALIITHNATLFTTNNLPSFEFSKQPLIRSSTHHTYNVGQRLTCQPINNRSKEQTTPESLLRTSNYRFSSCAPPTRERIPRNFAATNRPIHVITPRSARIHTHTRTMHARESELSGKNEAPARISVTGIAAARETIRERRPRRLLYRRLGFFFLLRRLRLERLVSFLRGNWTRWFLSGRYTGWLEEVRTK